MLDLLRRTAAGLPDALRSHRIVNDTDLIWESLRRLLLSHAPSGGCTLPGAILDEIEVMVKALDLADRFIPEIGSTGNAGIWLGADKTQADLIVVSHMDRPSFRLHVGPDNVVYPICAVRVTAGEYRVGAKSVRFADGKLTQGAQGTLVFKQVSGQPDIRFEPTQGDLRWYDTLLMDIEPTLKDGIIQGTGLDNCLGVITMLGAAAVLRSIEGVLRAHNRRLLFVFTDQEEGIPEAFFGHGAARLMHAMPPPALGCIIADAHTVVASGPLQMGRGGSHGNISAWSRGSVVPPNYLTMALELAEAVNAERPHTVQINTGYLSRSDDMPLGRWTQILGMIGAPMTDAHTGYERAALIDLPSVMWWLSHFTVAALALDSELARRYALIGTRAR